MPRLINSTRVASEATRGFSMNERTLKARCTRYLWGDKRGGEGTGGVGGVRARSGRMALCIVSSVFTLTKTALLRDRCDRSEVDPGIEIINDGLTEDVVDDVRLVVEDLVDHHGENAHLRSTAVVELDCALLKLGLLVERLPLLLEGVDPRHVAREGALLLLHDEELEEADEHHDLGDAKGAHLPKGTTCGMRIKIHAVDLLQRYEGGTIRRWSFVYQLLCKVRVPGLLRKRRFCTWRALSTEACNTSTAHTKQRAQGSTGLAGHMATGRGRRNLSGVHIHTLPMAPRPLGTSAKGVSKLRLPGRRTFSWEMGGPITTRKGWN